MKCIDLLLAPTILSVFNTIDDANEPGSIH